MHLGEINNEFVACPFKTARELVDGLKKENVDYIFLDFHAEATAEKICFSKFLAQEFNNEENALIKGFFGTHTHVQTADEQILSGGTAFITDVGMTGAFDSILGVEKDYLMC